ncbi:hypothetical protein AGMMS50262_24170 [Bacteroidia bacterium]|nr:hypothetical protein AGMMS50262_24170 [Bacteroidia bacterium]
MKMKSFVAILSVLSMMLFSKCELPSYNEIDYVNNADYDVYFIALGNRGKHVNTTYSDTTIFFDKKTLGSTIKTHSYIKVNIGTSPIENYFNNIPSDTLSIFYFHPDTLAKYDWEEVRQGYMVLRRYDLSIEDINLLYNKYGVPEIPYPPSEVMRDMKMYPPYGK